MIVQGAVVRFRCPRCGSFDCIGVLSQSVLGVVTDRDMLYCHACLQKGRAWRFKVLPPQEVSL